MANNSPDFQAFMQSLAADATPSRPHPIAQRDELRIRMKRYHEDTVFKCGDFVKEKQGLGFLNKDGAVSMFWRFLDFEEPVDFVLMEDFIKHATIPDIDCLLWQLSDDGKVVLFVPHNSSMLELDVDQE